VLGTLDKVAQGTLNPFEAIPKVIEQRDDAFDALAILLAPDTISVDERMLPSNNPVRRLKKIYALWCLEGMGTEKAYSMLFDAASSMADKELKGIALRALANAYYMNDYAERTAPDKELIHLFVTNVDDRSMVPALEESIGHIARLGLKNWMGRDFGEPQVETRVVRVGGKSVELTPADRRARWWEHYSSRLVWNAKLRVFEAN
jgi:hypothetical protein